MSLRDAMLKMPFLHFSGAQPAAPAAAPPVAPQQNIFAARAGTAMPPNGFQPGMMPPQPMPPQVMPAARAPIASEGPGMVPPGALPPGAMPPRPMPPTPWRPGMGVMPQPGMQPPQMQNIFARRAMQY